MTIKYIIGAWEFKETNTKRHMQNGNSKGPFHQTFVNRQPSEVV